MRPFYSDILELCNKIRLDCIKRTDIILRFSEEAFRISQKEENTPLYNANPLDFSNPTEPQTSLMLKTILNYKQNEEFILFKNFAQTFLYSLGFKGEWISKPKIKAEKVGRIDISIIDEKYAIIFESKLKKADFQRNQLARYINTITQKGIKADNIYIVLIPGEIHDDFVNEVHLQHSSVWKLPQDWDKPQCAISGNPTNCWCDKENAPQIGIAQHCNICNDYFGKYYPHTIAIDRDLAEWISKAKRFVDNKQEILIASMTVFADYIKGLYNIRISNKMIMEIKNELSERIFKEDSATQERFKIVEQKLSDLGAVKEALETLKSELANKLLSEWRKKIKDEWPLEIYDCQNTKGFYVEINGVKVGCWNGIGQKGFGNDITPFWGFLCDKATDEQKEMVKKILEHMSFEIEIEYINEHETWIAWNSTTEGDKICSAIYKSAEKLGFLKI